MHRDSLAKFSSRINKDHVEKAATWSSDVRGEM